MFLVSMHHGKMKFMSMYHKSLHGTVQQFSENVIMRFLNATTIITCRLIFATINSSLTLPLLQSKIGVLKHIVFTASAYKCFFLKQNR